MWVANEWRRACGAAPVASPAWRSQAASRRRTSEGDSLRPLFERNRAGSAGGPGQVRAAPRQVALQRPLRGLSDREDPRLRAFAEHPQLLGVKIERVQVQVDDLLTSKPARIRQLEHGAVAELEWAAGGDAVEQRSDVVFLQRTRQVTRTLW